MEQNNHFNTSIANRNRTFSREVNKKYICKLCAKIMTDPVQTCRGELACSKCYKEYQIFKPGFCPIDGEPINANDLFPDRSVSREISKLECFCENEKHGCTWKGALIDIITHEETCGYARITCIACDKKYVKLKLEEHECPHRKVSCCFCGEMIEYVNFQIHEEICEQRPIKCPFQCGMKFSKMEMFNHTFTCENILAGTVCPYAIVGCKYQLHDSESLSNHMQTSEIIHAAMVVEKLFFLETDHKQVIKICNNLKKDCEDMQKQLKSKDQEISQLSLIYGKIVGEWEEKVVTGEKFEMTRSGVDDRLTKLESTSASLSVKEAKLNTLLRMQSNFNMMLSAEKVSPVAGFTRDLTQLSTKIDKLDINNAVASSNLADMELKLQLLENTSYTGRQLWKIDNFKYRMSQAEKGKITALHSAPSFTEIFGYKFCTRLYLNGDGLGKNTHLSIFFVVMKTQYDELLKWPFVKRITFRLLNHEDKSRTRKESFLSDRNSSRFQKPIQEMNIAAGCPMFIEKNKLKTEGYIVNDSLFIETIVEDERTQTNYKVKITNTCE